MGDVLQFKQKPEDEDDELRLLDETEWITLIEIMMNSMGDDDLIPIGFIRADDYFETDGYLIYVVDSENQDAGPQFASSDVEGQKHLLLFDDLGLMADWLYERLDTEWLYIRGQI